MAGTKRLGANAAESPAGTRYSFHGPDSCNVGILDLRSAEVDPITIVGTIDSELGVSAAVQYADELLMSVLEPHGPVAAGSFVADAGDACVPAEPAPITPAPITSEPCPPSAESRGEEAAGQASGQARLADLATSLTLSRPDDLADSPCEPEAGVDGTLGFLEGTRILGLHGDIPVETMNRGDRLITRSGAMRAVRWVGRRSLDAGDHTHPQSVWPVRIDRGAFADGLPERTLWLSPDHAIYLDGCLVPAKALVNGRSITQDPRRYLTYYHIELETHDILLAEGLAAESYLDTGNRLLFESADGEAERGADAGSPVHAARSCAPVLQTGPILAAIRAKIDSRLPARDITRDPGLRALAKGAALPVSLLDSLTYAVELPAEPADIQLVSKVVVPAELFPDAEDRRVLGLAVAQLFTVSEGKAEAVALDSPLLTAGWYGLETACRWTNGNALVPAALTAGATTLLVRLAGETAYPLE
ncbi:Hint domain-containing protein [Acidiphilium sp. C61]|jgi:hypothetical protein|uniref:Hint domain-containing protein n=1 Tax=Acidiphilium sp. C61 TaxID=1671485 RepID=UPI00157AF896|nr:Hint domain-containing protein [Acidiphilium sp. C61]